MSFSIQDTTTNQAVNTTRSESVQYFSNTGTINVNEGSVNIFAVNTTGNTYILYLPAGYLGQMIYITIDQTSTNNVIVSYNTNNTDNYNGSSNYFGWYVYRSNGWVELW